MQPAPTASRTGDAARPRGLARRVLFFARRRGAGAVGVQLGRWGLEYAVGRGRLLLGRPPGTFRFAGADLAYVHDAAGFTWANERAVEVAVARHALRSAAGERVLEVGNVLAHYGERGHLVVDKYEDGPGVVRRDVLDLGPQDGPFDLVLSISTVEHVGWDEQPRDEEAAVRALARLRSLVAPGGRLVVTVPVGYHPRLDAAIRGGALAGGELRALRRGGRGRPWREVPVHRVWDAPYDFLTYTASGVLVADVPA
jgi:SAM-dependent methyltransferase